VLDEDTLMLNSRKSWGVAVVCVAGLATWLGGERAQADWGGGFGGLGGFGVMGWGLGPQTPASVNFLNDHALARINSVAAARPQPLRAPRAVVRDVDFFNRYDAATRAAMEESASRRRVSSRAPAASVPTVADNPPPARPVVPLADFFNKMRQLIWPADAPTEGDLAAKRSTSDATTLEVFDELRERGYAQLATATDARSKLLDYGRPALRWMRDHSTTPVSDAFHAFLLSLYDSIGQSSEPPAR
jgi:hypothetical protein